jgi:hypothetical protein
MPDYTVAIDGDQWAAFIAELDTLNAKLSDLEEAIRSLQFNGEEVHIGDIGVKLTAQSLTISET